MAKINNCKTVLKQEEILESVLRIANDDHEMEKLNENSYMFSMSSINQNIKIPTVIILDAKNAKSRELTLAKYLFHNPRNLVSTVILSLVWMSISIIYFGMTIGKLPNNAKIIFK